MKKGASNMKKILFMMVSMSLLASCTVKQDMGEGIGLNDYFNNEKPSDKATKKKLAEDRKAELESRKNRTNRHGIDAARNKLEELGDAVGDKFNELTGSDKDWQPKLMEFHSMKIVSKRTQKHGAVSVTLHPLSRAPIDVRSKSKPRHGLSYRTQAGTKFNYQTALRQGMVLAKFTIKNASNEVLRPDLKTRMIVTFQGKDEGVFNFNAHVSGGYAEGTRSLTKPEDLGFDGEYFPPQTDKDVVVGLTAPEEVKYVTRNEMQFAEGVPQYFSSKQYKSPVQIALYGMPVQVNAAGVVVKRANFKWTLYHRIDVWNALVKKHNVFTAMFAKSTPKLISYKETILLNGSGKKIHKKY